MRTDQPETILSICRKKQGVAEAGNTCLQTPGTCESCPDWWLRATWPKRHVRVVKVSGKKCLSCGKSTTKRKGKSPAPIGLQAGPLYATFCMTCAKQISNKLDVMIAAIEERYGKL